MKKLLWLSLFLGGCASAQVKQARQQIINDLSGIVAEPNCEIVCAQLRGYLAAQAGK